MLAIRRSTVAALTPRPSAYLVAALCSKSALPRQGFSEYHTWKNSVQLETLSPIAS